MCLSSDHYTRHQLDQILKNVAANDNSYTAADRTVYHEVFSKDDLDRILELEADRFQHLKYPLDGYKTETKAVLGEFNKNNANPEEKLFEVLRATAYQRHTYSHTTMGFIEDIEDMPNQYEYSLQFYNRYYRPEYTTIVLVGDVKRDEALSMTKKYFGAWKRGTYVPEIPSEGDQKEPRENHVDWPSETLPLIYVAFRGPAYSDIKKDKAALDLLAPIAFGENSDLYQRLVLKEQKVESLGYSSDNRADPELFYVSASVKDERDLDYVRQQIIETFKRLTTETVSQAKLDATRSRLRYSFALGMDSSEAIAGAMAQYIALRRSPETLDKLYALYDTITPQDLRDVATRYFVDNHRTIVTLATEKKNKEAGN